MEKEEFKIPQNGTVHPYSEYLSNNSAEKLFELLYHQVNVIYDAATLPRWMRAPNARRRSLDSIEADIQALDAPEEPPKKKGLIASAYDLVANTYNNLTNPEQLLQKLAYPAPFPQSPVPNPPNKGMLQEEYAINRIWNFGETISELGAVLLSSEYNSNVDELLNLIVPNPTTEDKDRFRLGLDNLIARWTFGEPIQTNGSMHGFSNFKHKYPSGILLLTLGPKDYSAITNARDRLNKAVDDQRRKAITNGSSMEFA